MILSDAFYQLILAISQLQVMKSQIVSHTEYLIHTYYIFVRIL